MRSVTLYPKVSIIVATFNREKLLREAICSVLAQTYENFELIVIDDGSTDNTSAMVSEFDDARLHYRHLENRGRSCARNAGLQLAKGKYIAFLDSDDLYLPDKLALQVSYLDTHPETGMIYTSAYCIDEKNKLLRCRYKASVSGAIYNKIAYFKPVTITLPTVMVRRDILSQVDGFDEKMSRFEDTDLWRRVSQITPIHAINTYTCKIRTHPGNHLHSQNPEKIIEAIHYYVDKIRCDDKSPTGFSQNHGIGRLYHYYGCALIHVPHMQAYGQQLLAKAFDYWPWYRFSVKAMMRYFR